MLPSSVLEARVGYTLRVSTGWPADTVSDAVINTTPARRSTAPLIQDHIKKARKMHYLTDFHFALQLKEQLCLAVVH
jgi:hypothetical protein